MFLSELLITPVLAHFGLAEVLVDGSQLDRERTVEGLDDLGIALHCRDSWGGVWAKDSFYGGRWPVSPVRRSMCGTSHVARRTPHFFCGRPAKVAYVDRCYSFSARPRGPRDLVQEPRPR